MKKKIIYERDEYKLQQSLLKHKKMQKDIELYNKKISLLEKKKELEDKQLNISNEIAKIIKETENFYSHTRKTEKELISYIAVLLSKMYLNPKLMNQKIIESYRNISSLIEEIQELKKNEVEKLNLKLEIKAFKWFKNKEKQLNDKLNDQIKIQEQFFERMKQTKNELAQIKNNFSKINESIERISNRKGELKIEKEIVIDENKGLLKIKNDLIEQHNKLKEKYNKVFGKEFSLDSKSQIYPSYQDIYNQKFFKIKNKIKNRNRSISASTALTFNHSKNKMELKNSNLNVSDIINYLSNENFKLKNRYNDIVFAHSEINKNNFNLKILIEKCIEDINYEFKIIKLGNLNKNKKDNIINDKTNIAELEKGLYCLTYIHDNVFGKNQIKLLNKSNSLITIKSKPPLKILKKSQ